MMAVDVIMLGVLRPGASLALLASIGLVAGTARAQVPCPRAAHLPLLTIDKVEDPAVPIVDKWQATFLDVPLSDAQIALLARNDLMVDLTREEMKERGTWVYIGIATAAAGAVLSSVGWVLVGKDKTSMPESLALTMALGGVAVGTAGLLMITESIQTPLEPHLAPTPRHRLTRKQMRQLVAAINQRLYTGICAAVERAAEDERLQAEHALEMRLAEEQPSIIVNPRKKKAAEPLSAPVDASATESGTE